ncbi:MAG: hypothetical protein AAF813_07470 [Pseudomonadota bacterium]
MSDAVNAFFDAFLDDFNANRMEKLHLRYEEPVVWIRPIGTRVFENRADFAQQMVELRQIYSDNGLAASGKRLLGVTSYGVGLHLAHLSWRHVKADGQLLVEAKTTFVLREVGDSFTISAQISHNEMFQRPLGKAGRFVS